MSKLEISNHLLDEIIDLVHKNIDATYEPELGNPNSNFAILTGNGRYQVSTGVEKTPELYESIRSVLQKSQVRCDAMQHFHIPQARCECGGYAMVYPIYDEQGNYSDECSIMLSCIHEIYDEIRSIALKHYARRIFVMREHKRDCINNLSNSP